MSRVWPLTRKHGLNIRNVRLAKFISGSPCSFIDTVLTSSYALKFISRSPDVGVMQWLWRHFAKRWSTAAGRLLNALDWYFDSRSNLHSVDCLVGRTVWSVRIRRLQTSNAVATRKRFCSGTFTWLLLLPVWLARSAPAAAGAENCLSINVIVRQEAVLEILAFAPVPLGFYEDVCGRPQQKSSVLSH